MDANKIVAALLEAYDDDDVVDLSPAQTYADYRSTGIIGKPSKYYKARGQLRGLAKRKAGASHVARVIFIYGDDAPTVSGDTGGHFTRGGSRIYHPNAYGKSGWSNMVYHTNTEVVHVGLDWLYSKMPQAVETYLEYKGLDDPFNKVTYFKVSPA